jgi:hypothetical protein
VFISIHNLVENAFLKIKKYLEVTTRYEKLAINYESVVAAEVEHAVPSTDDDITEEETDTPVN